MNRLNTSGRVPKGRCRAPIPPEPRNRRGSRGGHGQKVSIMLVPKADLEEAKARKAILPWMKAYISFQNRTKNRIMLPILVVLALFALACHIAALVAAPKGYFTWTINCEGLVTVGDDPSAVGFQNYKIGWVSYQGKVQEKSSSMDSFLNATDPTTTQQATSNGTGVFRFLDDLEWVYYTDEEEEEGVTDELEEARGSQTAHLLEEEEADRDGEEEDWGEDEWNSVDRQFQDGLQHGGLGVPQESIVGGGEGVEDEQYAAQRQRDERRTRHRTLLSRRGADTAASSHNVGGFGKLSMQDSEGSAGGGDRSQQGTDGMRTLGVASSSVAKTAPLNDVDSASGAVGALSGITHFAGVVMCCGFVGMVVWLFDREFCCNMPLFRWTHWACFGLWLFTFVIPGIAFYFTVKHSFTVSVINTLHKDGFLCAANKDLNGKYGYVATGFALVTQFAFILVLNFFGYKKADKAIQDRLMKYPTMSQLPVRPLSGGSESNWLRRHMTRGS